MLTHEHWDWFLAIIYFLPELFAAALGGLLAACLFKVRVERMDKTRTHTAVQASSAMEHQAARCPIA